MTQNRLLRIIQRSIMKAHTGLLVSVSTSVQCSLVSCSIDFFNIEMCNKPQTHLEGWPKSADYAFHLILLQVTHEHVLDVVTEWKLRNEANQHTLHTHMV